MKINYKANAKKALKAFKKRSRLPKVAKKRNPNDATMRNIYALKKRVAKLEALVSHLLKHTYC